MPPSLNVFWKELLSFVRDRRALLNQVVLPLVLMPLFMFGPSYLVERLSSQAAAEAQRVAVRGAPEALEQALKEVGLVVVPDPDPEAAAREGRADAGLVYEEGRVAVYLALAQGGMKAEVLKGRIEHALERYKAALVEARLRAAGLDPGVLEPFRVEVKDVSPPEAREAGIFGFLVPMMLLMFILTGAMPVVSDATAGEKERGTLEVLLAVPAPTGAILLGKAGAAMVAALLSTASGVGGLMLGGWLLLERAAELPGGGAATLSFRLGAEALFASLVTGVLFAAFAVGVMIFLGMFAKTYREAQTYMGFLYMVLVLPAVLLGMASSFLEPGPLLYLIPVAGPMMLLDAVLRARADLLAYVLAWGSTLVYAAVALFFAALAFRREEVVFRN